MYPPHPSYPPPPSPAHDPNRFPGKITIATVLAIVGFSVFGVVARLANHRTHEEIAKKQAALPAVGATGTLAHAPASASLCPAKGGFSGWPCKGRGTAVAPASRVRVMKAFMVGRDAMCRYWVQGGPSNDASGDAPCDWFEKDPARE